MKKIFYALVIVFFSTITLYAQLPAIGGPATFSSQGYKYRLKSFLEYRENGALASYRYVYDKDGYIEQRIISTDNENEVERDRFVYNEKKQLIEKVQEAGADFDQKLQKSLYEYDNLGRLGISAVYIWLDDEYQLFAKQSYEYEGDSFLPKVIHHDGFTQNQQRTEEVEISFDYNEQGKPTQIKSRVDNSYLRNTTKIFYDNQNRITKLKIEVLNPGTGQREVYMDDYKYEENGNMLQTGSGDFLDFWEYDNSKSGAETYFPPQFVDFYAMAGSLFPSTFFMFKIPYEGLAHQVTKVSSTNGAENPAELLYEFEYEENPSYNSIGVVETENRACILYTQNGEMFVEAPVQFLGKEYRLFDSLGVMHAQGNITSAVTSLGTLEAGVYILSVEGRAYKVII